MIKAQIPYAEVLMYEPDLTSITSGRGSFVMEFSHYEEVPAHLSDKVIALARQAKEEG
jgi:elongation factor G